MGFNYTLVQYECLKCHHRWTELVEWDHDPFTGEYTKPTPEHFAARAKYWKCGECFVRGRSTIRKQEDRR